MEQTFEQKLVNHLSKFLDGEERRFLLGEGGGEIWSVQRKGNDFIIRDRNIDGVIQGVQDLRETSKELIRFGGGIVKPEESKWLFPNEPMTLRELLKGLDGLPDQQSRITPQDLDREVSQFRQVKNRLDFAFQNENRLQSVTLETVPYLTRETKNSMLEQTGRVRSVEMQHDLAH